MRNGAAPNSAAVLIPKILRSSQSHRLKREFKFNEFHEEEAAVKVLSCRGSDPNYKMVKREKQLMKREKQGEKGRRMTGEQFLESPESIVKIELDPMSKTRRN